MRGNRDRGVDLPKYLLAAVDAVAGYRGVTLKQQASTYLWQALRKEAYRPGIPDELSQRLEALIPPYAEDDPRVRPYARKAAAH